MEWKYPMLTPGKFTLSWLSVLAFAGTCIPGCVKPPAASPPAAPKVEVSHPIVCEIIDEDEFNGTLASPAVVEIRARVRGYIQKVHFQDGDLVAEGDLLFELDPRPFQIQIDQAIAREIVRGPEVSRGKECGSLPGID